MYLGQFSADKLQKPKAVIWRAGPRWMPPLLIALIPILLAIKNSGWIFSPPGWLDPWVFLGYGLKYDVPTFAATYYKVSRVPWILAEFAAHHLLAPLVAQYTLQIVTRMVAGLGVYFSLLPTLGLFPAFLGGAFLLGYTDFYAPSGTGGADYMNVFAVATYALTFWAVTAAARRRRPIGHAVLVGALFALCCYTDVLYSVLAGALLAYALTIRRLLKLPFAVAELLSGATVGIALVTLLLGVISLGFGREFVFFWPEIQHALDVFNGRSGYGNQFLLWSSGWYADASYLGGYIGMALVGAIFTLVAWRRQERLGLNCVALGLLLQFSLLVCWWSSLQLLGNAMLEPEYMSVNLIVPLAAATAAVFSAISVDSKANDPPRTYITILLTFGILLAAVLSTNYFAPLFRRISTGRAGIDGLLWTVCGLTAIVGLCAFGRGRVVWLVGSLILGVVNVAVAQPSSTVFASTTCTVPRDFYLAVIYLNRMVRSYDPGLDRIFTWADETEKVDIPHCGLTPISYFGYSFASTGNNYIANPFPLPPIAGISDAQLQSAVGKDMTIVLFTTRQANADALKKRYAAIGTPLVIIPEHIQVGELRLNIFILRRQQDEHV